MPHDGRNDFIFFFLSSNVWKNAENDRVMDKGFGIFFSSSLSFFFHHHFGFSSARRYCGSCPRLGSFPNYAVTGGPQQLQIILTSKIYSCSLVSSFNITTGPSSTCLNFMSSNLGFPSWHGNPNGMTKFTICEFTYLISEPLSHRMVGISKLPFTPLYMISNSKATRSSAKIATQTLSSITLRQS